MSTENSTTSPTYRPLVSAAADFGISRSVSFALSQAGLLDTFKIGQRRYVYMDSLRTLPDRLKAGGVSV